MNKHLFVLVLAILLVSTSVYACESRGLGDSLTSFCRSADDSVCDAGELPFVDSDCGFDSNFDWVLSGWFLKLLVLLFLVFLWRNSKVIFDRQLLAVVLLIAILVYIIPPIPFAHHNSTVNGTTSVGSNESVADQDVVVIDESSSSKVFDNILGWGVEVGGGNAFIGWIIIIIILLVGMIVLNNITDVLEDWLTPRRGKR